MSLTLIRNLASVRQEFRAARAVLSYAEQQWAEATENPLLKGISKSQVTAALGKVEQTYLSASSASLKEC